MCSRDSKEHADEPVKQCRDKRITMQSHDEFGCAQEKDEEYVEQPVSAQRHCESEIMGCLVPPGCDGCDYVDGRRRSFLHRGHSFVGDVGGVNPANPGMRSGHRCLETRDATFQVDVAGSDSPGSLRKLRTGKHV